MSGNFTPHASFKSYASWDYPTVEILVTLTPEQIKPFRIQANFSDGFLLDPCMTWSKRLSLILRPRHRPSVSRQDSQYILEWLAVKENKKALDVAWARDVHDKVQSRAAQANKALNRCRELLRGESSETSAL